MPAARQSPLGAHLYTGTVPINRQERTAAGHLLRRATATRVSNDYLDNTYLSG